MGAFLERAGQRPDAIVASPARRAAETASLVVEAGGWHAAIRTNERLYGADPPTMLEIARAAAPTVERLMIVGHEPASSQAVSLLVGGGGFTLPTAAVAGVELDVDWASLEPGCGRLVYLVVPRLLERARPTT
jgi:phosphohistidine phosphatase